MNRIKSRFEDFRNFAMKGNVLDLAVGVIIGGAFGKIVSSLVNDIIMPLIGLIVGRVNLSTLTLTLMPADLKDPNIKELVLRYGAFLQNIVDFLIIAASIYLFIKLIEKFKRKQETVVLKVETSRTEELLVEIRDLLKENNDINPKH